MLKQNADKMSMHNGVAVRAFNVTHNKQHHATPTNNWCSASSYSANMLHYESLRFVVCPACVHLSGASNFTQSWSQDFAYQCMSTVGSFSVYFPPRSFLFMFRVQTLFSRSCWVPPSCLSAGNCG